MFDLNALFSNKGNKSSQFRKVHLKVLQSHSTSSEIRIL